MAIKHLGKPRVGGDHGGAERPDRSLLLEQGRGVQAPPPSCGPDASADLEVDMPVGVAGSAGLVNNGHRLQPLDRHHLLPSAGTDPCDRMQ